MSCQCPSLRWMSKVLPSVYQFLSIMNDPLTLLLCKLFLFALHEKCHNIQSLPIMIHLNTIECRESFIKHKEAGWALNIQPSRLAKQREIAGKSQTHEGVEPSGGF